MTNSIEKLERYRGCMLGLAASDALGTALEFQPQGSFTPITDMIGGGPFSLKPGQWTDDTSMSLCLSESLIECRGFDPRDQMERYVRWWNEGYLSSTGVCFDIGNTTRTALSAFQKTENPISGPTDPYSAGNGSFMSLALVPMFYAKDPREVIEKTGESFRTAHGAPAAIDACRYLGALIVGALHGGDKDVLLSDQYSPVLGYWRDKPLVAAIAEVATGSFKLKNPPDVRGSGYVVQSLEAALWAFYHGQNFAEGCLLAVNLGDDADTTGAIYGQIAGAFNGGNGIPEGWRTKTIMKETVLPFAENISHLTT